MAGPTNIAGFGCCGGGTGGTGAPITTSPPNCYCTQIPETLTMVSASETCNFSMFQSCTIQYGPVPGVFTPLNLGANAFISTTDFLDPLTGCYFYYLLTCQYNQFSLTRLYPVSPYGSPYRDGILYSWLTGSVASGNYCSADRLVLDTGSAFPGSDLSCSVTINGGS